MGDIVRGPTWCAAHCEWAYRAYGLCCPQGGCEGVRKIKILALDLATHTGWAWSSDGVTIAQSGVWDFTVKKDESSGMRLIRFRGKLNEIKESVGIDLVVYEIAIQMGKTRSGGSVQAEIQGVLKLWCEEQNPTIEYKGFAVKSIKSHATNNGNAGKDMMVQAAIKKWKRPFESEDEVDARWILDYAFKELK